MSSANAGRTEVAYADGRTYLLPKGWSQVTEATLTLATERTWEALSDSPMLGLSAFERMASYYRVDGHHAGATFCEVEPNDPYGITATDLWAVTTLSVKVPAREGRRLLDPGRLRTSVHRHLRRLEVTRPLTDLADGSLDAMYDLYCELRGVGSSDERGSNWWVFASKLCARKRPELFPVRDALVCAYLSGGEPLGPGAGRLGWFANDIQVFAHLISNRDIRARLRALQDELDQDRELRVDGSSLRLLDAALWTYAKRNGVGAGESRGSTQGSSEGDVEQLG